MRKQWLTLMSVAVIATLVLAACGSGGDDDAEPTNTTATGGTTATTPAAGGDATEMPGMTGTMVSMVDAMAFDPDTLTVAAGEEVEIMLANDGAIPHNMSIDDAGVDEDLDGGESTTFTFTAPDAPGEYEIYCNVPGHREAGMVATLVVQ